MCVCVCINSLELINTQLFILSLDAWTIGVGTKKDRETSKIEL